MLARRRRAHADGGVERGDQVVAAETARVVADDLGQQRFLADRAAAGVGGADPGPVIDSFAGLILLSLVDERDDIPQSPILVAGRSQGQRAVDSQSEVGDVRE